MNPGLLIAGALVVLVALAHSLLGERYILRRLFRRGGLPRLFGGEWFTRQTLRFAWHITSLAWIGLAAILLFLGLDATTGSETVLRMVALIFALTGLVAAVASKGRHLSWPVFLAIAALAWLGASASTGV